VSRSSPERAACCAVIVAKVVSFFRATFETGNEKLRNLGNIVKANKLNETEARFLTASVELGKMPADERLANVYKQLTGFNKDELTYLQKVGVNIAGLDNHIPHVTTTTKVGKHITPFNPPKAEAGAGMKRTMASTIFDTTPEQLTDIEKLLLAKETDKADEIIKGMKRNGMEIFDDNIVSALAKRSVDNSKFGASREMVDNIATRMGKTASELPPNHTWVKVNSKAMKEAIGRGAKNLDDIVGYDEMGIPITRSSNKELLELYSEAGEEIFFHPAVAKKIETFIGSVINDEATSDLLRNFDDLQNLWKASITSIFPAFHGRNAISNVFQNFLDIGTDSLNPVLHGQSASLIKADRKLNSLQVIAAGTGEAAMKAKDDIAELLAKPAFTDKTGHVWSVGQIRQTAKEKGIAFVPNIVGSIDVKKGSDAYINTLFGTEFKKMSAKQMAKKALPVSQEFVPFEVGRSIGTLVEEQSRLVNFMSNLTKTGDPTHAAQLTKQFLFDYGSLTPFEKTFMKRLIPFFSFTRKNLELQVSTLIHSPGKVAAEIKAEMGEVILVGSGRVLDNGNVVPMTVKVGDMIFFQKYLATKVRSMSEDYLLIKEEDIYEVLKG